MRDAFHKAAVAILVAAAIAICGASFGGVPQMRFSSEWDNPALRAPEMPDPAPVKARLGAKAESNAAYGRLVLAQWAAMKLDALYLRCDAATTARLAAFDVERDARFFDKRATLATKGSLAPNDGGKWAAAWVVEGKVHLLATGGGEEDTKWSVVLWDGRRDWPVANFKDVPSSRAVRTITRMLTSGDACNDLAVMLDNGTATCDGNNSDYREMLLKESLKKASPIASWNLGVIYERRGEDETAKLFYERARIEEAKKEGGA